MDWKRRRTRIDVDVDVTVTLTTVLDTVEARIVDISEDGARIEGAAFPAGAKLQIEYEGQTVFGRCRWSEIDRMGVEFPFGLHDGPLYRRLLLARAMPPGGAPIPGQSPAMRDERTAFGRRS